MGIYWHRCEKPHVPVFLWACGNPVGTGRKFNVRKMFRRRPGRLLNVLCTFDLRRVTTGKFHIQKNIFKLASQKLIVF